ncbi:aspartate/glutamate racemase family protein [uncultured Roseibium sp.]|uniref:aspartate/glutamate racemase family protein n=1 Tax=uncultured Roseibium sp. TaxID=1936171 RepID=UPI002630235C|nr:aspartate/glutamate racemase family protein [uncultured Roseibium sp.]
MTSAPKHILVINPNTTVSMTEKIGTCARSASAAETRITAINPVSGPAAIQGPIDGEAALPGLYALVDEAMASGVGYDALIIACFDDTGLWPLKRRLKIPVLGIGEAAYYLAALRAEMFSVVTTLPVSVPVLEENLKRQGLAHRCGRVRASSVPVLELEEAGLEAKRKIRSEIAKALAEDEAGAIALGCAGMADLARELADEFKVPVIDGVAAATRLAEAAIDLSRMETVSGLETSLEFGP